MDYMMQALEATKAQNAIEDAKAMEVFGCNFEELDYDDKDFVLSLID